MNKKGFFFIIVAFVLLAYILTSTYFWVRAIEMEESRYSDSFRTSTMDMLLAQVTPDRVTEFTNISARYGFYRLNHHSIENPVIPSAAISSSDLDGTETQVIQDIMQDLIMEGSASGTYFEGGVPLEFSSEERLIYTLGGWRDQLNASLIASGFELEQMEIDTSTFAFAQTNYTQFEVSFVMDLVIVDSASGSETSLVRTYNINTTMDATGFIDPYIARESVALNLEVDGEPVMVGKKVFMHPYSELGFEVLCSDYESGPCYRVDEGNLGQGWFYGPAVDVSAADSIHLLNRSQYILVGNYSDVVSLDGFEVFGAYILTNEPTTTGGDCANDQFDTFNPLRYDNDSSCELVEWGDYESFTDPEERTSAPFIVYPDFEPDDFTYDYTQGAGEQTRVLFIAASSHEEVQDDLEAKEEGFAIYDIENLRDTVLCGYYLPRNNSPSFLHRMMNVQEICEDLDPATALGCRDWPASVWGIETTTVGRWAGGNLTPSWDPYSRVDIEFFSQIEDGTDGAEVNMIKGMPGCKDAEMCSTIFPVDIGNVGHFRLSHWARDNREADFTYWINTDSGLDEDNIGCENDEAATCEVP